MLRDLQGSSLFSLCNEDRDNIYSFSLILVWFTTLLFEQGTHHLYNFSSQLTEDKWSKRINYYQERDNVPPHHDSLTAFRKSMIRGQDCSHWCLPGVRLQSTIEKKKTDRALGGTEGPSFGSSGCGLFDWD
ncbi:hypothetical protein L1987_21773 [Smallanthus sonchifolius]|uniref:Uncharacterized protein n=1 Tax=Smallanthus sonchifolius TaxID=185202 RepID=A0ACB9IEI0_9ASTR|nr:hypothetical protein L1987_21773 [Smallanthus sonchifolius]